MTSLSETISRGVGRQGLMLQQHSPRILFLGGVAGMIGTTVLASRATLKLERVLDNTQGDLKQANNMDHPDYSESDRKKDIALIYTRAGANVAKLYGPSFILGVASIAMLTKSHNMLEQRNGALMAAYTALDNGFKEYRSRVIDKYGEDEDREFRYGSETVEIENEKGKKETVKRVGPNGASIYARFFDQLCPSWSKNPEYNRLFLRCQQNYANDLLNARGHLFLNEVYEMLGIPHSQAGAIVGWIVGGEGDGYVDFGVFIADGSDRVRDFVNGREGAVLLDFNVDGVIYNQIGDDPGEAISWQLEQ